MTEAENRRKFTRVAIRVQARFECDGKPYGPVDVRDVSLNGLSLLTNTPVPLGTSCRVVLILSGAVPNVEIRTLASVVRADGQSLALKIDTIEGEDSFAHLRNLVLYNAKDADAVESELLAHIEQSEPT